MKINRAFLVGSLLLISAPVLGAELYAIGGSLNGERLSDGALIIPGTEQKGIFIESSPGYFQKNVCGDQTCWVNNTELKTTGNTVSGDLQFCWAASGGAICSSSPIELTGSYSVNSKILNVHEVGHPDWDLILKYII